MFTDRNDSDNYATDKSVWEMIVPFLPKDKVIWSPFFCDGKMKQHFAELGFDIIHDDKDFFSYEPIVYDIICDNPPFSSIKDVCKRLLELDKPFILVARSNLIFCKWFQQLFKEHLQIIIPSKRPTFTHLNNPTKGYTPPFGTFFFTWKMELPQNMILL